MNGSLLDLSEKIDGFEIGLFETVVEVAESLSIPFFVVGAMARDIILSYGYGIETGRATQDIDLGVQVSDWEAYGQLREGLIATGEFRPDKKQAQRLIYKEPFPIDIIPFGAIADPDNSLSWPPKHEITMSTLGFEDAYHTSITVRLRAKPALDIKFVSLPGLALLKIISWNENRPRSDKDAYDLLLLMRTYLDAGNRDRLWNEEIDLVGEDFDYLRAGSRLLGRDIAAILSPEVRKAVIKILDKETGEQNQYRLVESMMERGLDSSAFEEALELLGELKAGILERL
ncbi:MAG: nucleotidyl transferase AbiEii/AbiGii toxin family protein [Deltaproteobacteria bacterium]